MKETIDGIFKNVKYWLEKSQLLQAINPDYYNNKNVILRILNVNSESISPENEAKRSMWNHHIHYNNMGDDILKSVNKEFFKDREFVKRAIEKYNRAYIFIPKELKASRDLALTAVMREEYDEKKSNAPILQYMPDSFKEDHEIALTATTRNIENLKYATNLKKNKYFIIDFMDFNDEHSVKQKILRYMDQDLLKDKKFISRLGCYDNLCENFQGDLEFVSNAVLYDISILKKTKMFDESIIKAALKNQEYENSKEFVLADIFRYIERFNMDYEEFNSKIKDKSLISKLFWEMGELIGEEFI